VCFFSMARGLCLCKTGETKKELMENEVDVLVSGGCAMAVNGSVDEFWIRRWDFPFKTRSTITVPLGGIFFFSF
jgi:hypothetical protein